MTGLQYLVYMEPSKSAVSDGLPPGEDRRVWSPTASTLTHGVRERRVGYDRKTANVLNGPRNSATRVLVNGPIAVMFAPSRDRS
jgi:hypothetical protein